MSDSTFEMDEKFIGAENLEEEVNKFYIELPGDPVEGAFNASNEIVKLISREVVIYFEDTDVMEYTFSASGDSFYSLKEKKQFTEYTFSPRQRVRLYLRRSFDKTLVVEAGTAAGKKEVFKLNVSEWDPNLYANMTDYPAPIAIGTAYVPEKIEDTFDSEQGVKNDNLWPPKYLYIPSGVGLGAYIDTRDKDVSIRTNTWNNNALGELYDYYAGDIEVNVFVEITEQEYLKSINSTEYAKAMAFTSIEQYLNKRKIFDKIKKDTEICVEKKFNQKLGRNIYTAKFRARSREVAGNIIRSNPKRKIHKQKFDVTAKTSMEPILMGLGDVRALVTQAKNNVKSLVSKSFAGALFWGVMSWELLNFLNDDEYELETFIKNIFELTATGVLAAIITPFAAKAIFAIVGAAIAGATLPAQVVFWGGVAAVIVAGLAAIELIEASGIGEYLERNFSFLIQACSEWKTENINWGPYDIFNLPAN